MEILSHNFKDNDWMPLPPGDMKAEDTTGPGISYWKDVLNRFRQNKLAVASVFCILLILLLSVFGPYFTGKTYDAQNLPLRNMPPVIDIVTTEDGLNFYIHPELRVFLADEKGYVTEMLEPVSKSLNEKRYIYNVNGREILLLFGKEGITLAEADGTPITNVRSVWNRNYLLGTDSLGRDMLTRLLYGGRISLLVAFIVSFSTFFIGVLYGGIAGYYGGNVDIVMMRIVEIILAIPSTIYVILLMIYFGQGISNILITMAATSWLGMSRLVRGQVLSLKEQEFILSAKCTGVRPFSIITKHLLPNCIGPIIVSATMSIPGAIATEAFMSFIGLGVAPPMPSWGILSNEGLGAIRSSPYQILFPSIAISLTMFSFNFFGDGLRDALDPRLRK